jgi:hypothetical protein
MPNLIGKIYTDIVVSCLTCLDKNNEVFSNKKEFEDEDRILVRVCYIKKVISPKIQFLSSASLLILTEQILFEIEKIVV